MADKLTHRPVMLPFLAEYTDDQTGKKSGGWAVPSMVQDTADAFARVFGGSGLPDPQDPRTQADVGMILSTIYGGSNIAPVAKEAVAKGAVKAGEAVKDYGTAKYLDWKYPNEPSAVVDDAYRAQDLKRLQLYGEQRRRATAEGNDFHARTLSDLMQDINERTYGHRLSEPIMPPPQIVGLRRPEASNEALGALGAHEKGYFDALIKSRKPDWLVDVIRRRTEAD